MVSCKGVDIHSPWIIGISRVLCVTSVSLSHLDHRDFLGLLCHLGLVDLTGLKGVFGIV